MVLNFKKRTLTKPDTTSDVPLELVSEKAELIDKIGKEQDAFEKRAEKIKKLQGEQVEQATRLKELNGFLANTGDLDTPITELGNEYQVAAGKASTSREVKDLVKVHAILGDEVFLELCSINITDVEKYLTGKQVEEVVTKTRGNRSKVTVTKRV